MLNRKLLITTLSLCFAPIPARAQFTAVITPPKKEEPALVAETPAKRDSLKITRLSDMRAWVDSAAGALGAGVPAATAPIPKDSLPAPVPPMVKPDAPVAHQGGDLRSGARAPDTATPLPLLVVAGALLLAVGLAIKARERA